MSFGASADTEWFPDENSGARSNSMATIRVTVDADGRIAIPNTRPGQTLEIDVVPVTGTNQDATGPIPEEERAAIKARVKRLAREIRAELPEPWRSADHGDLLYGDDGLPK